MSGTANDSADWRTFRRTRLAYRLLFLLVIAGFAASQVLGGAESDTEGLSSADALFAATGFIYALFLYFFLKTAGLVGCPWPRLLGVAFLALIPGLNILTLVILEVLMGVAVARLRRAAVTPTHVGVTSVGTVDRAAHRLASPARRPLVQRLVISVPVGLVVFAISCYAAFDGFRDLFSVQRAGKYTLNHIANVQKAIEAYRREKGAVPDSLSDLTPPANSRFHTVDGWGRPLHYAADGSIYRVTSYGRDGKPGGEGLDRDLSTVDLPEEGVPADELPPLPTEARATLRQFVGDLGHFGRTGSGFEMFLTSIWAGVIAFVLSFVLSGIRAQTRRRALVTLGQAAITVGATVCVGMIITVLHSPSGH